LLMQLRRAAADITANEVGVSPFEVRGRHDVTGQDELRKSWGKRLDPLLHSAGKPLSLAIIPSTGEAVVTPVLADFLGHVRVRPRRLGACR
jgi:hypothetical protein